MYYLFSSWWGWGGGKFDFQFSISPPYMYLNLWNTYPVLYVYTWTLRMVPHLGSASPLTVFHMSGYRFLKYGCSSCTSYSWQRGYESWFLLVNKPSSVNQSGSCVCTIFSTQLPLNTALTKNLNCRVCFA